MALPNWKGRPYRPVGGTGYIRVYKPDVNELLKPLSEKAGLGSAILTGNIINPVNRPQTTPPVVTPSSTPAVTSSPTPSVTPTFTPTPSPTEPYDIYLFEECGNTDNKFRFENISGSLIEGDVYHITSSSGSSEWNTILNYWNTETMTWDSSNAGIDIYGIVIPYSATGVVYSGTGVTFTHQVGCP